MECPRCLMDDAIEGITIHGAQCNVCDAHDAHEAQPRNPETLLAQMRGKTFDVIVGISGGLDSTWLAMWMSQQKKNALLVHFDNHFNDPRANRNIERTVKASGLPFVRVSSDTRYVEMCRSLLAAGVPDVDIANDMAMATLVLDVARMYRVPWVVNGHHYRTEGWNPIGWTYMDGKYLRSLAGEPPRYMDFGLWKQFRGIKQGRVYDHLPPRSVEDRLADVQAWCGFEWYGAKHCENDYTQFVGEWYLPTVHGIDKRLNYLSADIRSGRRSKADAKAVLAQPMVFPGEKWVTVAEGLGFRTPEELKAWCLAPEPTRDRSRWPSYRPLFRRLRFLVWLGMKANMVSASFYRKYAAAA